MTEPRKTPMTVPPPTQPRPFSIVFESTGLLGLTAAERRKALAHLAHLLMLAAGVAAADDDDER
jgi:hypothetical protein